MTITSNISTITVTPQPDDGYTLLLYDDFDGATLDRTIWTTPDGHWYSWKNMDARANNVTVGKVDGYGCAIMKVNKTGYSEYTDNTKEPYNRAYEGCLLENSTKTFKYGKVEVRMKTASADMCDTYFNLWPYIPSKWPPEVTFVETSGGKLHEILYAQHFLRNGVHLQYNAKLLDIDETQWHVYKTVVTKDTIVIYVDNIKKCCYINTNESPDQIWKLSSGIFVGVCKDVAPIAWSLSAMGGCPRNKTFPQYTYVDYIKIYQKD